MSSLCNACPTGKLAFISSWKSIRLPCPFSLARDVLVLRNVDSSSFCCCPPFSVCAAFRSAGICGCTGAELSFCPKSMRSLSPVGGAWDAVEGEAADTIDGLRLGIGFFSLNFWPCRIGVTARICSTCFSGVGPSLCSVSHSSPLELE